jgi:hypothetical protein
MPTLDLNPDYLEMLILKVRAVMGKEPGLDDDTGSNPIDDDTSSYLKDGPSDLSREEIIEEIEGLSPKERLELVALMWLGRGDGDVDDWLDMINQAAEREDAPTPRYLLSQPLIADYWEEGLEKLGLREGADEVEEI